MRIPCSNTHRRYPPQFARQIRGNLKPAAAAALGLLAAAVLTFILAMRQVAEPVSATILPVPIDLPEFSLSTGSGLPFTRNSLGGRHHLVFFGFTNCPDVCPTTLQQLASARRRLAADGVAELPEIVFISVDPDRDTPDSVRDYAAAFGAGVTGVRGDLDELNKLTAALGIFHARPPSDSGYDVEHSAAVVVVDPESRFSAVFSAPHTVDAFVHDWPIVSAGKP